MFKSNSRFAALAEDINTNNIYSKKDKERENNKKIVLPKETSFLKEENSFLKEETNFLKKDYHRRSNRDDRFETKEYKERIEKEEKIRKEKEKKRKEEETKKNLAVENFPDLNLNKKSIHNIPDNNVSNIKMNYINKVSTQKIIKDNNKVLQQVKPGYIEIKYDKENTNKIVYRYGKGVNTNLDMDIDNMNKPNNSALEALVKLHETRTQAYIAMWGYETWQNMFIFPNYDYQFFDKLDEEYELQMQEEEDYDSENNEDYY